MSYANQDILTSSKSWRAQRREIGERNATQSTDDTSGASADFFNIRRPRLKYPQQLEKPIHRVEYKWEDPFQHLGLIGYRRNTYIFRGQNKEDHNIYGSQHMSKTLWLEEKRRQLIAEESGITADVDKTSIAGTAGAFYLGDARPTPREPKNKYYGIRKASGSQQQPWTYNSTRKNPRLPSNFSRPLMN